MFSRQIPVILVTQVDLCLQACLCDALHAPLQLLARQSDAGLRAKFHGGLCQRPQPADFQQTLTRLQSCLTQGTSYFGAVPAPGRPLAGAQVSPRTRQSCSSWWGSSHSR